MVTVIRRGLAVLELVGQQRGHAADRGVSLLSTEGGMALMTIACPTFSSFSLEKSQGIERGRFIVLRCVRPWIITAVSTVVSTPRLAQSPALTANRSRPDRSLSAEAQAGGEVAVFLAL
jgi:hypothetical protein